MSKKDINIEAYDENDAFYMGTDEEYEQFLKSADIKLSDMEDAEPVADTQRINLNETINLQGVIDRFKKTAGDIESGARKLKDSVVNKMDMLKSKKEESGDAAEAEHAQEAQKTAEKGAGGVTVTVDTTELVARLDALSKKLETLERTGIANKGEQLNAVGGVASEVRGLGADITEIKQAVTSVTRLNDSVFDLKNTQMNTKNAIIELETSIRRLKKKCVLGVTVLSMLSAIVIALEIILMLS